MNVITVKCVVDHAKLADDNRKRIAAGRQPLSLFDTLENKIGEALMHSEVVVPGSVTVQAIHLDDAP